MAKASVICICALLLAQFRLAPAQAEGEPLYLDTVAGFVGQVLPARDKARFEDISDIEGAGFSRPTKVYQGGATLDIDGELVEAVVLFYEQDGTIAGVELVYTPDEGDFADFTFEEQQHSFDVVYGNIADNYAGDEGGKTLLYDESGGLYQYRDPQGTVWTLSWIAGLELTLSFDTDDFEPEHSSMAIIRALNQETANGN